MIRLTKKDYDDIRKAPPLKVPEIKEIMKGKKFILSAKVNGDMTLIDVKARCEPYQSDIGKNRKAWYVDVSSPDFKGSVNIKKLKCLPGV